MMFLEAVIMSWVWHDECLFHSNRLLEISNPYSRKNKRPEYGKSETFCLKIEGGCHKIIYNKKCRNRDIKAYNEFR
jgi:hypothetical protein